MSHFQGFQAILVRTFLTYHTFRIVVECLDIPPGTIARSAYFENKFVQGYCLTKGRINTDENAWALTLEECVTTGNKFDKRIFSWQDWNNYETEAAPILFRSTYNCLSVSGMSNEVGAAINQQVCSDGTKQQWMFVPNLNDDTPFVEIQNYKSGLCMTAAYRLHSEENQENSTGYTITQTLCRTKKFQLWFLRH